MAANLIPPHERLVHTPKLIFYVKAQEDLYLRGTKDTVLRVSVDTINTCSMCRTQSFDALFRYYTKRHGLCKDEIEFIFTDILSEFHTPASVNLKDRDTISVRSKKHIVYGEASDGDQFAQDMGSLLNDTDTMDVEFLFDGLGSLYAHRAVLASRSPYFHQTMQAMYQSHDVIQWKIDSQQLEHVQCALEFIYTNKVLGIESWSLENLCDMLRLAGTWTLEGFKDFLSVYLIPKINFDTVVALYDAAKFSDCSLLQEFCIAHMKENLKKLMRISIFRKALQNRDELTKILSLTRTSGSDMNNLRWKRTARKSGMSELDDVNDGDGFGHNVSLGKTPGGNSDDKLPHRPPARKSAMKWPWNALDAEFVDDRDGLAHTIPVARTSHTLNNNHCRKATARKSAMKRPWREREDVDTPLSKKVGYFVPDTESRELVYEGPPEEPLSGGWPKDWIQCKFRRKNGSYKGRIDKYWYPPMGFIVNQHLRSMIEVKNYMEAYKESNGSHNYAWAKRKG